MISTLADERYISLTPARTWKVRRLRRDPRELVAPSTFRGRERRPRLEGRAHVRTDLPVEHLLRAKYGWQKRILDLLDRKSSSDAWVTIEIEPDASELGQRAPRRPRPALREVTDATGPIRSDADPGRRSACT